MYLNTGRGGSFFNNLFDWLWLDQIRKEPVSREEFYDGGLSETEFVEYLKLMKRLYTECLVNAYNLGGKDISAYQNLDELWTELTNFCIEHNLILEFADSAGNRMPARFPFELRFFNFIYQYPQCVDTMHICSLDEFRLAVEMYLAGKDRDWYLDLKYNTRVICGESGDCLMRYDLEKETMVMLTEHEASELLSTINAHQEAVDKQIAQCLETPPRTMTTGITVGQGHLEILREQEAWITNQIALEREAELLCEVYEIVADVLETGVHVGVYTSFPDDTLYIHKGKIVCERECHRIEQATAILRDRDGKDIKLNVSHCLDCEKFFLHYNIYQHYREKYGTILGNIRMIKNGEFNDVSYDLADESPLRLCGYSVSQKAGLSQGERQAIIASCIESGAMSKDAVIHLLNWFIEVNGAKKSNEQALKKWHADLDFALAYNSAKQNHYQITKIERYSRNRFYIGTTKPRSYDASPVVMHPKQSNIGKRVKHKSLQFGAGEVIQEYDGFVVIAFDNGKIAKFGENVFQNGIVKML